MALLFTAGFNLYNDDTLVPLGDDAEIHYEVADKTLGNMEGSTFVPTDKLGTTIITITADLEGVIYTGQVQVTIAEQPAPQMDAMVSAGTTHSLALDTEGNIWAWGDNRKGQIDWAANDSGALTAPQYYEQPVKVTLMDGDREVKFRMVSAANNCSYAVDTDGVLWCWGNWTAADRNNPIKPATPVKVEGVSGVEEISIYNTNGIIRTSDNNVYTFTVGKAPTAVVMPSDIVGVRQVAAGEGHYLALVDDASAAGKVYAWGNNTYSQLGLVDTGSGLSVTCTPTEYKNLVSNMVYDTYASEEDMYAAVQEGTLTLDTEELYILKKSNVGTVANPAQVLVAENTKYVRVLNSSKKFEMIHSGKISTTTEDGEALAHTTAMIGIKYIAAGKDFSAAVTNDGKVYLWGRNDNYQSGGDNTSNVLIPTLLTNEDGSYVTGSAKVHLGENHSIIVDEVGKAWAWGYANNGQTGTGTDSSKDNSEGTNPTVGRTPIRYPEEILKTGVFNAGVEDDTLDALDISAGVGYTLILRSNGVVYAAGQNTAYRMGIAKVNMTHLAADPEVVGDLQAKNLVAGEIIVTMDGESKVYTYQMVDGEPVSPTNVQLPVSGTTVVTYDKLWETYLAGFNLLLNGRTTIVEAADKGEVAFESANTGVFTVTVDPATGDATLNPVQIGTAALRMTNAVSGHTGTINIYVTQDRTTEDMTGIAAPKVVAGANFSAALRSDGTVWAWGMGTNGETGTALATNRSAPQQVQIVPTAVGKISYLTGVVDIAAGDNHLVMVTINGKVYTTGLNDKGQLGYIPKNDKGQEVRTSTYARKVEALNGQFISSVAANAGYTMALTRGVETTMPDGTVHFEGGQVWAWGQNDNNQLGRGASDPTSGKFSTEPALVLKGESASESDYLSSIVAISAGWNHVMALRTDGAVFAWGKNDKGQLGIGTTVNHALPVRVLAGESRANGDVNNRPEEGTYLEHAVAVAAGLNHSLILVRIETETGVRSEIYSMGDNAHGQLGIWTVFNTELNYLPRRVLAAPIGNQVADEYFGTQGKTGENPGDRISGIVASKNHNFAITEAGDLYAWGLNDQGQLGINVDRTVLAETYRTTPILVAKGLAPVEGDYLKPVRALDAAETHTIAMLWERSAPWCAP